MWNNLTDSFVQSVMTGENPQVVQIHLEKALLTLRILRKLSVLGFFKPHIHKECVTFTQMIFPKARSVFLCCKLSLPLLYSRVSDNSHCVAFLWEYMMKKNAFCLIDQ